jgi:hypothetical protein
MKKSILPSIKITAVILAGTFALTACHKTPSTPPIVGKNNGVLEKAIGETAPKGRYSAPQTWKATYTHEKLTVNIDAKIETPDVDEYPVFQVTPDVLTQAKVDNLVKVLMQGKTIYPIRNTNENGDDMTKSEILQEIANLEAGTNSDMKAADPAEYAKEIQLQVAALQGKLATAPDTIERKPSNGKLAAIINPVIAQQEPNNWEGGKTSSAVDDDAAKYPNYMGLNVEADFGNAYTATLTIQKSPDDKDDKITFSSGVNGKSSSAAAYTPPPKLTMTSDQGADAARKVVSELGLTDMRLAATTQFPYLYSYYFTHTIQGLPMDYTVDPMGRFRIGREGDASVQKSSSSTSSEGSGDQSDLSYIEQWPDETLRIDVNNTGACYL